MKHIQLMGVFALIGAFAVSCAHKNKTASADSNPYQNNPYYTGSDDSTSTASSAGSSEYPTYTDSNPYAPSNPAPAPAVEPPIPSYTGAGTGTYSGDATYPSYTGGNNGNAGNSYGAGAGTYSSQGYTGSGSGNSHTVMKGENLYRISLQYGTSVTAIQNANGLSDTTIYPGQVLVIP